ncbi:MAG: 3-phosphoshikimate 1-carboxyvinyltransferase [Candidatus Cryptobacteroides sp.]
MICTVIQNKTSDEILDILQGCEMAEIRLDSCPLTPSEIDECFSSDVPLVATCRISVLMEREQSLQDDTLTEQSRMIKASQIAERRLCRAIEAGARYVDVEIEAPKQMSKRVRQCAHENGTVFIRSYHDFNGTDSREGLSALVDKCRYHGADVVKLVTTANSSEDVERVMSLYADYGRGGQLIAFCMGEAGRSSRMDCLGYGAPYTYAALNGQDAAAPGQWDSAMMKEALYGGFHFGDALLKDTRSLGDVVPVTMPASKSYAQRAIIAAALAEGVSHLRGYSPCGDNEAALAVARELGAEVEVNGTEITIKGIAASPGCLHKEEIFVGESGLLTRMMMPVLAQLADVEVRVNGEKTLLKRPLTGAAEIMEAVGASVRNLNGEEDGAQVKVPLAVKGPLSSGKADVSGKNGSQLVSGLLMALPFCERNSTLVVHDPKSIPYMFITMEVLKKFGIKMSNEMLGGRDFLESDGDWSLCTELVFKMKGGQRFKAADIDLEGDWSAAANFLVAGAVFGKAEIDGLDTTSLQADLSIMDILMDAGASLSQTDGDRGRITVQRAPLTSFEADASNCPDLFPIISVLAAFCEGTSRLAGVGRLANKESDRAGAIMEMLAKLGVKASIEGDVMSIEGHSLARRLVCSQASGGTDCALLKGGQFTSHHDHRMVMALKVASLGADSPIVIDDTECVGKSFPQFQDTFGRMLSVGSKNQ